MLLSPDERDPIKVADWMEFRAMTSAEARFSLEEVHSYILADGTLSEEGDIPYESSERLVASGSAEVRRRAYLTQGAYPFELSGTVLHAHVEPAYTPYITCLLLADRESYSPREQEPTKLFEHLVCEVMAAYLGGIAIRFGAPRDTMPKGIIEAIKELARLTGDRRMKDGYPYNAVDQDLGLDVAVWKSFPDEYPGKVQVYMQCTTAQIWELKKSDCNLDEWRGILYWSFYPILGLAIPYIVPETVWNRELAGILLVDRIRISSILKGQDLSGKAYDWWRWCRARINDEMSHPD